MTADFFDGHLRILLLIKAAISLVRLTVARIMILRLSLLLLLLTSSVIIIFVDFWRQVYMFGLWEFDSAVFGREFPLVVPHCEWKKVR